MPIPIKVLLVEDSPDDVFFFKRAVHRCDKPCSVEVCGDAEAAMAYLEQAQANGTQLPDFIFLDLHLPVQSGNEFLEWIGDDPNLKKIPVIVVSGSLDLRARSVCEEMGARSFYSKPLESGQLSTVLASIR